MSSDREKMRDTLIDDCFGNVKGKKDCQVLVENVCLYGKCSFYKTNEQYEADRKKYDRANY